MTAGASQVTALALLLLLSVLWSISYVLIKIALDSIPPYTVAASRIALAAALLYAWLLLTRRPVPRAGRDWGLFAALGLLGNTMPFILIAWGQQYIDAGLTSILLGMVPVFTVIMVQFATDEEPLTGARVAGVALGLAGLVVLVGPEALVGIGAETLAQLAVVAATACYAATAVLARRVGSRPGPVSAAVLLLAAAMAMPLSIAVDQPWQLRPTPEAVAAIVVLGAFSTALATIVFFRLVAIGGATLASLVNYLIPPLGVLWGVLLLGERPGWTPVAALTLIVAGIALVNRRPR